MASLSDAIQKAKEKEEQGDTSWQAEMRRYEEAHSKLIGRAKEVLFPNIRPASPKDYKNWLCKWIEAGGTITHYYDRPMSNDFRVAIADLEAVPLCGSSAIQIIVPPGIKVKNLEKNGHCNFYFMEPVGQLGGWVPAYDNLQDGGPTT